jgi:hypothetical protein
MEKNLFRQRDAKPSNAVHLTIYDVAVCESKAALAKGGYRMSLCHVCEMICALSQVFR